VRNSISENPFKWKYFENRLKNSSNVKAVTRATSSGRHSASTHHEGVRTQAGDVNMFTKIAIALALVLGTASGTLAATKQQGTTPNHDVYDFHGKYVGSDPDANVRFELRRDSGREQSN
jgi:hypothetical protein